jgi:hypothetical protein
MAAAPDVEGRGGESDAETCTRSLVALHVDVVEPSQPIEPDSRLSNLGLVILFLFYSEFGRLWIGGGASTMMPLVVGHHDRHAFSQITQDTPGKSLCCLRALVDYGPVSISFFMLRFRLKGMPVGHQHLAGLEQGPVFQRNDVEGGVVILGVFGPQHLQTLFYG